MGVRGRFCSRSAMAEISGDSGGGLVAPAAEVTPISQPLSVSGSFKEGKSSSRRRERISMRPSLDADEFMDCHQESNVASE